MNQLISIITPCYNSGKFIKETIQSVLDQTYINWEWLIVDDNSKDNSVEIIKTFKDKRIKLIQSTTHINQGAAISRNIAIEMAQGRFITFLDSDDVWMNRFLEISINYLKNNNEELVYASYRRSDENLKIILKDFIAEDYVTYKRLLYNCPIPMLTAMYDTHKIGKVKIPLINKREDLGMWFEILKKTPYARAIKEPLGIYRMRPNSYSRNKISIAYTQFNVYFKFLKLSLPKSLYYTFCWAINGLKKYERI